MVYRRTNKTDARLGERRQAILNAGTAMVTSAGFRGLSMQVVADRAGIATGTVYRYFPSKQALCTEIVTVIADRELNVLRDIAACDGASLKRLWTMVIVFTERALQARTLAYALMGEPVSAELNALRLDYRSALADIVAALIGNCARENSLPEQDSSSSAAFIVGAFIEGVIGPHALKVSPHGRARLASDIARFCVRGAGAQPGAVGELERCTDTENETLRSPATSS
ncbi:MAG: AcrR family transcriptional regulator [Gammaproteobacteria bacterium]|jgi:AcrR family transcriptional regulator